MGDYVTFGLTVYRCPPEYAEVFLDIIDTYRLRPAESRKRGKILHLGVTYTPRDGARSGVAHDVIAHLANVDAAAVAWEVFQGIDGEYSALGDLFRHTPELGDWHGACDELGRVLIDYSAIKVAHKAAEGGNWDLFASAVLRAAGDPWVDEFASYGLTKDSHVEPPKIVDVLWDRKTGTVEIDGTDHPDGPVLYSSKATLAEEARGVLRDWLAAHGWTLHGHVQTAGRAGRVWDASAYRTPATAAVGGAE